VTAAPAFAPDRPLAFAHNDGPAFHGLFQTETRRGPISEAVAKLWRGNEGNEAGVKTALAFFPKNGVSDEAPPLPAPAAAKAAAVELPPPARISPEPTPAARARGGRNRAPLDLSSFMKWRRA
jgi:hypothetical protein